MAMEPWQGLFDKDVKHRRRRIIWYTGQATGIEISKRILGVLMASRRVGRKVAVRSKIDEFLQDSAIIQGREKGTRFALWPVSCSTPPAQLLGKERCLRAHEAKKARR